MVSPNQKTSDDEASTEGASPAPDAATSAAPNADPTPEAPQETLYDAAVKALKPAAKPDATVKDEKAPTDETAAQAAVAAKTPEDGEFTDDELKTVHERTAKRIRELLASRAEERKSAETANARVAELEPKAKSFEAITNFMKEANLLPEEVSEGFELMKLIKHDPFKALEMMRPYYERLVEVTGGVLSPELQAAVDSGEISDARARQLQQAQSRAHVMQAQSQRVAAQMQAQQESLDVSAEQNARATAWQNWVSIQRRADPEFAATEEFVVQQIRANFAGGIPPISELPKAFDAAKAQVEKRLAQFRPKKPEIIPTRPSSQSGALATPAEPKSILEAARAAIGR